MPNTINLRLLDNKQIVAEMQGISLGNENSYRIIAGEQNATEFVLISKPTKYLNARYTVEMVNSKGFGISETDIIDNKFTLPIGMAVAGYGFIQIRAYQNDEEIPFMPLKVKIWETLPEWQLGVDTALSAKVENGHVFMQDKYGQWHDLGVVQGEKGGIKSIIVQDALIGG